MSSILMCSTIKCNIFQTRRVVSARVFQKPSLWIWETSLVVQAADCVRYLEEVIFLEKVRQCEICGQTFEIIDLGWTRKYCYNCSPHEDENCSHSQAVTIKRRAIKKALIQRHGGKCEKCSYDKCLRALEFHHLDPTQKDFGISKTLTKSIKTLFEETDKCILLCSNCHAEEHQKLYEQGYSQFNPDI